MGVYFTTVFRTTTVDIVSSAESCCNFALLPYYSANIIGRFPRLWNSKFIHFLLLGSRYNHRVVINIYFAPIGVRNIVVSMSVCMSVCFLFVCLSVCLSARPLAYLKTCTSEFHKTFCTCYLWPVSRLTPLRFCNPNYCWVTSRYAVLLATQNRLKLCAVASANHIIILRVPILHAAFCSQQWNHQVPRSPKIQ